jgi:hypothetical protein
MSNSMWNEALLTVGDDGKDIASRIQAAKTLIQMKYPPISSEARLRLMRNSAPLIPDKDRISLGIACARGILSAREKYRGRTIRFPFADLCLKLAISQTSSIITTNERVFFKCVGNELLTTTPLRAARALINRHSSTIRLRKYSLFLASLLHFVPELITEEFAREFYVFAEREFLVLPRSDLNLAAWVKLSYVIEKKNVPIDLIELRHRLARSADPSKLKFKGGYGWEYEYRVSKLVNPSVMDEIYFQRYQLLRRVLYAKPGERDIIPLICNFFYLK